MIGNPEEGSVLFDVVVLVAVAVGGVLSTVSDLVTAGGLGCDAVDEVELAPPPDEQPATAAKQQKARTGRAVFIMVSDDTGLLRPSPSEQRQGLSHRELPQCVRLRGAGDSQLGTG